jgi:hypothetical protein
MMLSFDEWAPEFDISSDGHLYLFLDSAQIESCAQRLFQVTGAIDLEPIYMHPPYDQLLEVTPYIVRVTPSIMTWFYQQQTPTAGFFFRSGYPLEAICSHFRHCIKVVTPYSSDAFFKMAHSEVAWVMLRNEVVHYWRIIDQAWLPTRVGWKILFKPERMDDEIRWPLTLNERVWQQLSQVKWMNTLQVVVRHLQKSFPALIAQEGFDGWLNATASDAYNQGFVLERDILFYFNIIGLLGEEAVTSERYPNIYHLIVMPSIQTPSQRIEQAAELAYQYSQTTREKQEPDS